MFNNASTVWFHFLNTSLSLKSSIKCKILKCIFNFEIHRLIGEDSFEPEVSLLPVDGNDVQANMCHCKMSVYSIIIKLLVTNSAVRSSIP